MYTGLIYFEECDHTDDLDAYAADVRTAGATITQMSTPRNGRAVIAVKVADPLTFQDRLSDTDTFEFSSFVVATQEEIDWIMKRRG